MLSGKGTHASGIAFVLTRPGSNQRSITLEASTFKSYLPVVICETVNCNREKLHSKCTIYDFYRVRINDAC